MSFDPESLDKATLVEANRKLHRRCQQLESEMCRHDKGIPALRNIVDGQVERLHRYVNRFRDLYQIEHRHRWRYCRVCRLKWWIKWKLRMW